MTRNHRLPSLPQLLKLDGLSCALMGAGLIAAAGPISALTQLPASLLFWGGIVLLPISAFMAISARLAPVPNWAANVVILGNCAWVVASLALPLAGLITPNALGWILLGGQAGLVAVLTLAEFRASKSVDAITTRTI